MNTPTPPRALTPPQVAERLAVTKDKVLAWIRAGELVAVDLASKGSTRPRYRVLPEHLEAFLAARRVTPPPPRVARRRARKEPEVIEYYR